MDAVREQNDRCEVHNMKKLGRVSNSGEIRQRVKQLVEKGEAAKGKEQRENNDDAPEPQEFSLAQSEH